MVIRHYCQSSGGLPKKYSFCYVCIQEASIVRIYPESFFTGKPFLFPFFWSRDHERSHEKLRTDIVIFWQRYRKGRKIFDQSIHLGEFGISTISQTGQEAAPDRNFGPFKISIGFPLKSTYKTTLI